MEPMTLAIMWALLLGQYNLMFLLFQANLHLFSIGKQVHGYLSLVARDESLSAKSFQSLAEAFPKDAWYCDDKLYIHVSQAMGIFFIPSDDYII